MDLKLKLKPPFGNWIFESISSLGEFDCQIDSGSNLTLLGFDIADMLGLTKTITRVSRCILFESSSGTGGGAIKIPSYTLPIGDKNIEVATGFIPFVAHPTNMTLSWIMQDICLVGTDVLNHFDMQVQFKGSNGIEFADLILTPHGLKWELEELPDCSIKEALEQLKESQEPIDTGYSSKLTSFPSLTPSLVFTGAT